MRFSSIVLVIVAISIAACSPGSRPVPKLNDEQAVAAAMRSLSPWNDGRPDQSNDSLIPPEERSDRMMFRNWVQRYSSNEASQHSQGYQPMPIPSSIGALIEEERRFEEQARAEEAGRQAEAAQGQAKAEAQSQKAPTPTSIDQAPDQSEQPDARQFDQDPPTASPTEAAERPAVSTQQEETGSFEPSADFKCRYGRELAKAKAKNDAERDRAWNIVCPADRD